MSEPSSAPVGGSDGPGDTEVADGPGDTEVADGEGASREQGHVVIRDRRRVDPQTGQVRAAYAATEPQLVDAAQGAVDPVTLDQAGSDQPGFAQPGSDQPEFEQPGQDVATGELDVARALADERLDDLLRLQAEYVNYRRRVERDRDVARDYAVASVLEGLLPVLDDLHLARQHGDLEGGPFAAIAEKIETTLARFGLVRYGEPGETFDPTVHEALMHTEAELAEGTTETTVVQILQPGYRAGERVLRAARVAVADPS